MLGQYAGFQKHMSVTTATLDVGSEQPLVERKRCIERLKRRIRPSCEPAPPEFHSPVAYYAVRHESEYRLRSLSSPLRLRTNLADRACRSLCSGSHSSQIASGGGF